MSTMTSPDVGELLHRKKKCKYGRKKTGRKGCLKHPRRKKRRSRRSRR